MQIKTIYGEVVNTDDVANENPQLAKLIELIEKSGLREWSHENNASCYVWGSLGDGKGWTTYYMRDFNSWRELFRAVNWLTLRFFNEKYYLTLKKSPPAWWVKFKKVFSRKEA